jgi:bifunctional pyridoxal-dependent enzyme with beta-cystathionase and maltose regulon repressor activities
MPDPSEAISTATHPPIAYGLFPHYLKEFVKEKSILSLEEAIMKATRDLIKAGQYTEEFINIFLKYYKIDRAKLVKIDLYDFDPNLKIQEETLREMERVFGKNGQGYVRLSFMEPCERIAEAMQRMKRTLGRSG